MARRSIVCTLFENDYHLGAGVLANSLHASGFEGIFCAGYRGDLPRWAAAAREDDGVHIFSAGPVEIEFHRLETDRNLTNYKPEFLQQMWNRHGAQAPAIYFFDADIFVIAPWNFFENWAAAGLALVADGNSPLPVNHPLRVAWRSHYEPHGFRFARQTDYHFNGGFVGISRERVGLLQDWERIQVIMSREVRFDLPITLPGAPDWQRRRTFPFYLTDQDALNIVADLEGVVISAIGSEGMGWKQPEDYMYHACGADKPWRRSYIRRSLRGSPPTLLDLEFWRLAHSPLEIFPKQLAKEVSREMRCARACARLGRILAPT